MKNRGRYNRNRFNGKKERLIMLGSAVFVLTALTLTGVYVKENQKQKSNDGYSIDYTQMEKKETEDEDIKQIEVPSEQEANVADEAEYDPMLEAGSGNVENPGRISKREQVDAILNQNKNKTGETNESNTENEEDAMVDEPEYALAAEFSEFAEEPVDSTDVEIENHPSLSFSQKDALLWPVVGNVLINYSMDKTTYFATLDQYKYNPAIIIGATEGEKITASANGKVISVAFHEETGNTVVMDLGSGYQVTYGQLTNIQVKEGQYVEKGEMLGEVAAPTIYYAVEGCNVYLMLTKDGTPVNPMDQMSGS